MTVRVKLEEMPTGDLEDPEASRDPPAPCLESSQVPTTTGWQQEVTQAKVPEVVPAHEEQSLQEEGNGKGWRPSSPTPNSREGAAGEPEGFGGDWRSPEMGLAPSGFLQEVLGGVWGGFVVLGGVLGSEAAAWEALGVLVT